METRFSRSVGQMNAAINAALEFSNLPGMEYVSQHSLSFDVRQDRLRASLLINSVTAKEAVKTYGFLLEEIVITRLEGVRPWKTTTYISESYPLIVLSVIEDATE